MKTYLVGGAVRDQLLNLPVHERDWVVVGSTPEEMLAAGFQQVGNDFPVFLHPVSKEEYALARQERKSGKGYTGFTCNSAPTVSLEEDLLRRDLTINAIAQLSTGELTDPYGGINDIHNKILRHVSNAFTEDPLRVLRVARFAARFHHLGFTIAAETLALMQDISTSSELEHLSAERVWKETEKALVTQSPHIYFDVLRSCGALTILFPEIDILFGIPQTASYHPEIDAGIHTLMAVEQAAALNPLAEVRFAALVHDLGKGKTPQAEWPKHIGHEHSGKPLVQQLCRRMKIPNDFRDLAIIVCEQHLNCHRATELKPATVQKLFKNTDAYRRPQRFPLFLDACEADARGRLGLENQPYPQKQYLLDCFAAASAVNAQSLNLPNETGKHIGEMIELKRIEAISSIKQGLMQKME